MALVLHMVNMDCRDVGEQAEFWAEALGVTVDDHDGNAFMRTIGGAPGSSPRLMFLAVPEGKAGKNRLHLDLHADDRAAEVDRLVGLGATVLADVAEWGSRWTVLADPEGNEFCVAQD